MKNNGRKIVGIYCGRVIRKYDKDFTELLNKQRKEITNREEYIIDPFVGYIKKRA